MVALIENEIQVRDQELKELVKNLSMDTMPNVSSKVDSLTTETKILHKLLKEQKLQRRRKLFALENGLLLFAIVLFGVLAGFAFYVVSGASAVQGPWEHIGSNIAVVALLFILTSISTLLYLEHYKHKLTN